MARRPLVIAFDVIETMFPLEPLRQRLTDAGQPAGLLELWFARLLRDAFALAASGDYRPFGEIAAGALRSVTGSALDDDAVTGILSGFAELEPHPDVAQAVHLARASGFRLVTLTNGTAENTAALLRRAGIDDSVEQILTVDDIRQWKPTAEVYRHACRSTGTRPDQTALVAAHAWDTHGAARAGLTTGWVARLEDEYPAVFEPPDVTGRDLVAVVRALSELPTD